MSTFCTEVFLMIPLSRTILRIHSTRSLNTWSHNLIWFPYLTDILLTDTTCFVRDADIWTWEGKYSKLFIHKDKKCSYSNTNNFQDNPIVKLHKKEQIGVFYSHTYYHRISLNPEYILLCVNKSWTLGNVSQPIQQQVSIKYKGAFRGKGSDTWFIFTSIETWSVI